MQYLGTFLIIYGILCLFILLTKPTWAYNTAKFKAFQKLMGKKGFDVFILIWALAALVAGILIVS